MNPLDDCMKILCLKRAWGVPLNDNIEILECEMSVGETR